MNDIPLGNTVYQETHNDMQIHGISYTDGDLDQSAQFIADICFDTLGKKDFEYYANSLGGTGFDPIRTIVPNVEDWQVGEGFAEAYLTGCLSCHFPWSNNRDLKNINSSLPGADMVGFHEGQFAFGEVKTSTEQKYPPQVTSKKKGGLNTQLKNLCHDHDTRVTLVQYLFHRVKNTPEYKEAMIAYLNDNKDFYVFGILVRDVKPNMSDWNYLKTYLSPHKQNRVALFALYLPQKGIQRLHKTVLLKGTKS